MKNINPDRRYLVWYAQRGPAVFGDWVWLTKKFLPALERFKLVAKSEKDFYLISDIYYKLGDIFFFIDAPLLSLKYFKMSINVDPKNCSSYREAGCRFDEIGQYKEAKTYLSKALELCPNDEMSQLDWRIIGKNNIGEEEEPLYKEGDKGWEIDELLANGKFRQVLSKLKKVNTLEDRQRRARAYGGLDKKDEVIKEWELMSTMVGEIEIQSSDWFYMPQNVWDNKFFWYAMEKLNGRFLHGTYPYPDILFKIIPAPKKNKRLFPQGLKEHNQRMSLFIQFQIARLTKDIKLSKELAIQYPQWTEVCKSYTRLNK